MWSERSRDVSAADDQTGNRAGDRLEQRNDLSAAAHAELGAELEGAELVFSILGIDERRERFDDLAFDRAASDRADTRAVGTDPNFLAGSGRRGAVTFDDGGHGAADPIGSLFTGDFDHARGKQLSRRSREWKRRQRSSRCSL